MNMGEFFNSLADYSFEDMQRKARMKEDEKAAAEKPSDGWTDEQDKAETKLLEDIFEGKKPEAAHDSEPDSEPDSKTVEKTTVKVTGDDAKKVSEKAAADDVMPAEEFDKLIGKKSGEGSDEELDDDVEAVMDMVYKLPPEKAKKIMDRLSGLNLGNVPSDKNVKKEC